MSATYTEVAVGVADAVIGQADDSRVYLIVSNPTANDLFIAFGRAAVVGQSLLIPPGNIPVVMHWEQYGQLLQGPIHAIFATASGHAAVIVGRSM